MSRVQSRSYGAVTQAAMPDTQVTWLHLLRHGEVESGPVRRCRGSLDVDLSARGRGAHDSLLRFCAGLPPLDGVYSSDARRTLHLARPLAAACGQELIISRSLREQHMGSWEGRVWEELNREQPEAVRDYWDDYLRARPPEGESFGDLAQRVAGWWRELLSTRPGGRYAVVTHIGVIRSLVCHLLGLPLDQALRLAPAYASHTQIGWAAAGAVVVALGERPWSEGERQ